MRPFPKQRAEALAKRLELDVNCVICQARLSFVIFALDAGDPYEITGALRSRTPDLWADGLAEPALAAVRSACDRGIPGAAAAALADLELHGGTSGVARAIVRRLAEDRSRRTRLELSLEAHAGERLRLAPPELTADRSPLRARPGRCPPWLWRSRLRRQSPWRRRWSTPT